ncbi:MAG TPA: DUF6428 family protein [Verrucomicrobiae bacterium]
MKLTELKSALNKHPEATVRFALPNGEQVPAHAHVTEVARIDKRFIDCGGTLRNDSLCRLQTWTSDDVDHRLTAGKLGKILDKATTILQTDDLDVDVEHEICFITQFPLESIQVSPNEITLRLAERHTACLAMDKCKPTPQPLSDLNPLKFNFRERQPPPGCCTGK